MTSTSERSATGRQLQRTWARLERRFTTPAGFALLALVLFTLGSTVLMLVAPDLGPVTIFVLPLVLGSIYLGPRELPWFVVLVLTAVSVGVTEQERLTLRYVFAIAVVFLVGFIILLTSFHRSRLGVAGMQGESMLVDLRDRIQSQGVLPMLPDGWYAESALRSAGGTPFAGDFVVAGRSPSGHRLDLVVVDVSGKGEGAGTRALLLSGAFSGLLGALPASEFLPAANTYLLRQNWDEGFATAIHLTVDLETGEVEVRTAGHPPGVQMLAGSGKWVVLESDGPLLGLFDDAEFVPARGRISHGDAVLLYTDGMVETRRRDIGLGIDRLVGQAERLLRAGMEDGAARLIDSLGSRNDDRALLLLHRR